MIQEILGRVSGGQDLSMDEMAETISSIMEGRWEEKQIALLLTGLSTKGETVEEIAGAAAAMRRHMTEIPSGRTGLLDTCGTGGDGSETFNISTAAAIVTAAAGVAVAKHGNRSVTSKSGSADVLAALGVNIEASVDQCAACLEEIGICFCFAPLMHQSMKHVGPVRKKLGEPTIFNMLGPLCNPASAEFQLIGVGKPHLRNKLAAALQMLGTSRAIVVSGDDGLDEVTLCTATNCTEANSVNLREFTWTPEEFGLPRAADLSALRVTTPNASAEMIRNVLSGSEGPARDIVVINAAAAIWTVDPAESLANCTARAQTAIDSGAARELVNRLAELSRR